MKRVPVEKQKERNSDHQEAKKPGEHVFLDLLSVKHKKNMPKVTKGQWRFMIDEKTRLKFSSFHETKDKMVEHACQQFNKWCENGHKVTFLRCDNAGETRFAQKATIGSSIWKLSSLHTTFHSTTIWLRSESLCKHGDLAIFVSCETWYLKVHMSSVGKTCTNS